MLWSFQGQNEKGENDNTANMSLWIRVKAPFTCAGFIDLGSGASLCVETQRRHEASSEETFFNRLQFMQLEGL